MSTLRPCYRPGQKVETTISFLVDNVSPYYLALDFDFDASLPEDLAPEFLVAIRIVAEHVKITACHRSCSDTVVGQSYMRAKDGGPMLWRE